jgi:hypothetical protein
MIRYSSRDERRDEVSAAEEYLAEELTPGPSADELSTPRAVSATSRCSWCGRAERSHTVRQLRGCRERLAMRAGRER